MVLNLKGYVELSPVEGRVVGGSGVESVAEVEGQAAAAAVERQHKKEPGQAAEHNLVMLPVGDTVVLECLIP